MAIKIEPISAFSDNYIWALTDYELGKTYIVDPGEAEPVRCYLKQNKLELSGILITHHHHDHRGGVAALCEKQVIPVYGPLHVEIPANNIVNNDDKVLLKEFNMTFKVIAIPGHTLEHIAYYSAEHNLLFCGDTLFSAGCGRVFEGTYEQMYASLMKLSALPNETKVYCAHEYTAANLKFAACVEPDNVEIKNKIEAVQRLRKEDISTIPSTIIIEKGINPFLRCERDSVKISAQQESQRELNSVVDVFATIREWKNHFK